MRNLSLLAGIMVLGAIPVASHAVDADALDVANRSGACGELGVLSASYQADGTISAVCNEDPTAIVPLFGALGPVVGLGAVVAAVAAGSDDSSSTPDTQ